MKPHHLRMAHTQLTKYSDFLELDVKDAHPIQIQSLTKSDFVQSVFLNL